MIKEAAAKEELVMIVPSQIEPKIVGFPVLKVGSAPELRC